jgi:hypothetical protein
MAKRKYKKQKKQNKNSFVIFFVIVIVLAILSFVITYLVMDSESVGVENSTIVSNTEEKTEIIKQEASLDGTWASYNDGSMLTISGRNYTIELPNVEGTVAASGTIVINNNTITFINTNQDSDCSIKPGVYDFTLDGNDELKFKKVNDSCQGRSERMEATWFKV